VGAGAAPWAAAATFRFGVPSAATLEFFGDTQNPAMFAAAVEAMRQLGGEPVEFELTPFIDAARLLYQGPWVAERLAAIGDFFAAHRTGIDPTVATIIAGAEKYTAGDAFKAAYELEALRRRTAAILKSFDVMLVPTAPRTYSVAEIAEQPIVRNSHLGTYTNFVNLLDLAAVATPAGMRPDGLPFGVTLIGPAWSETALLQVADRLQRSLSPKLGGGERLIGDTKPMSPVTTPPGCLLMVVVGAHLTGQPLNWQLTDRGGRLVRATKTAAEYRLYALANTTPAKPGLVREPGFAGAGIEVEVWALPADTVGSFVDGVPQPLTIGKLKLEDGSLVMGFLVEPAAVGDATEITRFGGWRAYLASLK
jgi:allophanate hydrolase